jgi:hypothetical protein
MHNESSTHFRNAHQEAVSGFNYFHSCDHFPILVICQSRNTPDEELTFDQFDTSSIRRAYASSSTVADWYSANYLSICNGRWENGTASGRPDPATTQCMRQSPGYTFLLLPLLSANLPPQRTRFGTLYTEVPLILQSVGITFLGLTTIISFGAVVQVGDRVCILYRCSVSVVLRRQVKEPKDIKLEIEDRLLADQKIIVRAVNRMWDRRKYRQRVKNVDWMVQHLFEERM